MTTKKQLRELFNTETAPTLAKQIEATEQLTPKDWSKRFTYFLDTKGQLVIVSGDQEEEEVDLALAYGLTYRKDRPLVLVLPKERAFPTLQRAPWLTEGARPTVHLHDGDCVDAKETLAKSEETIDRVCHVTEKSPREELRSAATPLHLGEDHSAKVAELVEWATKHPLLDPGHRQGERAWHCMGQKVLSIRRSGTTPKIRAGIHTTKEGKPAFEGEEGTAPTVADPLAAIPLVEDGIKARLSGKYHRADEHWLQAVIRRDPTLVGVEQPALREVPAWRPAAKPPTKTDQAWVWGRGFIDLVGLDGHGDIRIVETKLAANKDELLLFQGLDYYIWAKAYRDPLLERLGAPTNAKIVVHYVIGDIPDTDAVKLSQFAAAQAAALTIPWQIQTVTNWFRRPDERQRAEGELRRPRSLPE